MLHYSKEVINNLQVSRSQEKGQCQCIWSLLRDSLHSNDMVIIGSSHSAVSDEIGLNSSIIHVGNWAISGIDSQGNRQADPILML